VHEVLDVAVDQEPGIWERLPVEEVWRHYVASVSELARSGTIDVLAHPDLAKIYARRPAPRVEAELAELLATCLAAATVAAEVSTAGLRKRVGEIYPSEVLLRALRRHGVPITLASDAHEPHLVGEDYDSALAFVRGAGYETVSVFDRRNRHQEPLG
jgi:histidinol-phosphatase (PHP family)